MFDFSGIYSTTRVSTFQSIPFTTKALHRRAGGRASRQKFLSRHRSEPLGNGDPRGPAKRTELAQVVVALDREQYITFKPTFLARGGF